MAKAKPIDSLECGSSANAGAAEVLCARFDEMAAFHLAASQPEDVDGIHDMRVASRRLRSALRDFSPLFEKKTVKSLQKRVKHVARKLGEVRNHDVSVAALTVLQAKAPNPKIVAFIDHLVEDRRRERTDTHLKFSGLITLDILVSLRADLAEAVSELSSENRSATFRSFGLEALERAHAKFLERAQAIFLPFDDGALHKFRLAAKRLRYALELFDKCWNGELRPFAKHASRIQSSLGEVHDNFEWIESLNQSISGGDNHHEAAAWLIAEFAEQRTAEYVKALDLWNDWVVSDLSGRLRAIINK